MQADHLKKTISSRRIGLDILRSIAILLVVWDHGIRFLSPSIFGNISPHPLLDGVDLFFVLSGWLVTGHLFHKIKDDTFTGEQVFRFYSSRWLRTLPAYWVVLAANIILLYFHLTPGLLNKNAALYAVFLQNFHKPLDLFFWESWSLSVEEWFYISFPVLLFIALKCIKKRNTAFLFTCVIFIVFGIASRYIYFTQDAIYSTDLYFRKLVLCRLDMIAWGGLAYYVFQQKIFATKYLWLYAIIGIVLWVGAESLHGNFTEKVVKFSLSGIAISMLMPFMNELMVNSIPIKKLAGSLSKISYSLYLVHLGVVAGIIKSIFPHAQGWHFWSIYVIASFALAIPLYISVEKPILNLRDKWLNNSDKQA